MEGLYSFLMPVHLTSVSILLSLGPMKPFQPMKVICREVGNACPKSTITRYDTIAMRSKRIAIVYDFRTHLLPARL